MELIRHDYNIDFIGKRRFFVVGSIIVNLLILVSAAVFGLNWGVDFAGGSELEIRFAAPTPAGDVRKAMEGAGFHDASVQVFGPPEDNSYLVRIGRISLLTPEEAQKANEALKTKFGEDLRDFRFNPDLGDKFDLTFGREVPPEEIRQTIEGVGIRVAGEGVRRESRVVAGVVPYTVVTSGIADKVQAALEQAGLPKPELRRVEFVGPQVGKQLRNRGILSVLYAAVAILIYIAFRFDTRFAPGAVVSMFHDIIVVFGYYVVTRREFNLTSVAVLLTIVGYSVNDTIVIYDRIRETMARVKGKSLPALINTAINETLARTLLTSFATALSLVGLLIFGVGQIFDFAAAMLVGILTGTYSSMYIASPMTIWLEEVMGKRAATSGAPRTKEA
ncbi:MAG: protein translocase subunit SecF [Myxococcales bacterium]